MEDDAFFVLKLRNVQILKQLIWLNPGLKSVIILLNMAWPIVSNQGRLESKAYIMSISN